MSVAAAKDDRQEPGGAALFEERLFEPDIARAKRAEPPAATRERLQCWVSDKLTFFL